MRLLYKIFLALLSLGFLGAISVICVIAYMISYYGKDLPDYSQLKNYQPPIVTRVYAGDGRLMAEFAEEKRVFVAIEAIPDNVKHAFLAAEDQNFYKHQGVDLEAIARAGFRNLRHMGTGKRPEGASTITQQVAKNFLLTNEVSFKRKIREAILAYRMDKAMSKDKLLELYLNEIYLGQGSYGVGAAAMNYFNKSLEELSIDEAAYLAALPKAPNNYHPVRRHDAAVSRRNWVIDRMIDDGYITESQGDLAKAKPLMTRKRDTTEVADAPYFSEEVRRELIERYDAEALYEGGLVVRTSLDPHLQEIAVRALRDGLIAYDHRRGWRGAHKNLGSMEGWKDALAALPAPVGMLPQWEMAAVLAVTAGGADLGFRDGRRGSLPGAQAEWAGKDLSKILKKADIIFVEPVKDQANAYALRQIPKIEGALIALDPHTGRVLAMQGGWTYGTSEFNRATQAKRQPGSAFKPFVYLAALDKGFTPATLVMDAPFVIEQSPGKNWAPTNYTHEYYGPTPIRVGVEKSRNLMTVRLADNVGMPVIADYARRFGIMDDMQPMLAYALGAGETTLLRLTTAYAQLVNGGKRIFPTFIDRIQDRRGQTIFLHDTRKCTGCGELVSWDGQGTPVLPDDREQIADPRTAYQMVSILEGVVQRGTATRIRDLNRPLAGKTGTTNDSKDAWFIGFSPDLVVGVFVGFDEPKTMGKKETGASAAVPIFKDFMAEALKDVPAMPFRIPPGIRQVRVNADTSARARPGDQHVIWEAFVTGTEPSDAGGNSFVLDGGATIQTPPSYTSEDPSVTTVPSATEDAVTTGTGGIY